MNTQANNAGNITINEFVQREVVYCVSSLISSISDAVFAKGGFDGVDEDEIMSLQRRDDYETPVAYHIQTNMNREELEEYLANVYSLDYESEIEASSPLMLAQTLEELVRENDHWQEFANEFDIEPETVEAYEHWIVSSWLADKLEEKGEIIARDIAGLTIWGRCTTGQAISMDYVIGQIYNEMIAA